MPDNTSLIKDLENLWATDFPLNRSMQLSIKDYQPRSLRTFAPLVGNTNTHNTAFAGSLYALQALSAWGLIWLELKVAGIDASIIHARGDIKFPAPLTTDIQMQTQWPDAADALEQLTKKGRIKFELAVSAAEPQAEPSSTFSGVYVVRL
ncbi:MAG: YiiD C-terminal domain-containing protein [Pseudomonadota bacterium]